MNTEIILPLPELKDALSGFNKIIGRRTTLPVLSCVKVSRKADGTVTLQATDLDAHATFTLNGSQTGSTLSVLVPMEQLNKAFKCSASSKQDLAIICEDKSTKLRYFIGGNPVQQPVNTVPVSEWPPCPEITTDLKPLQPGFGVALKEAMQCCSEDSTRHTLMGACLDAGDAKAHYVVATNGRFLYSANSFTFPFKEAIIVPDSKFINGSLLDAEPCFLAVQPAPVKPYKSGAKPALNGVRHLCFQSKQWQFITREIQGNYPNWKQVVPTMDGRWTLIRLQQPAIEELLKVIPNLPGANEDNHPIKLRLENKCLWVEGKNKDDQECTKIAISDVTITGKPKEICLNRHQFSKALKFGLTELAIEDELTPIVCTNAGKKMVIMPLRPPAQTALTKPTEPAPTPAPIPVPANPQPQRQEERKTDMPKVTTSASSETPTAPDSPFKQAMQQVDGIREALKSVLRDLATVTDTLKVAEKEKKSSDREMEEFRDKLREIQDIKL